MECISDRFGNPIISTFSGISHKRPVVYHASSNKSWSWSFFTSNSEQSCARPIPQVPRIDPRDPRDLIRRGKLTNVPCGNHYPIMVWNTSVEYHTYQ